MKTPKLLALVTALGAAAFLAVTADAQTAAPAAASGSAAAAPTTYTVTLSGVHLCCGNCVKGVTTALSSVTGATATSSQSAKTVVITASDKATAQKAVDALTTAGFFGISSNADIKVNADTGAKAAKVSSVEVTDVHLCCAKCVTGVKAALANVPGYAGCNPTVNGATFTVTGDIAPTDVFAALQKAGFTGKAGATQPEVAAAPKT
jgi:copper chaperone CopZ